MLQCKRIKTLFTFLLLIMHNTKGMHLFSAKDPKYTLFWKIVFVMRCSTENTEGTNYLKKLNLNAIAKNDHFSFLHKPFQVNKSTVLMNPDVKEYSLEMKNNLLQYNNNNLIEEARITCKGKVLIDGLLNSYELKPNTGLLEQILIAMIKEYIIDRNFEECTKNIPQSYLPTHINLHQDILKEIIQKQLTYNGFTVPKNKYDCVFEKTYFPNWLLKDRSIGKNLYLNLCPTEREQWDFAFALGVNHYYKYDPLATVNCEKYEVTIHPM